METAKNKYYNMSDDDKKEYIGIASSGYFAELSILLDDALIELEKGAFSPIGLPVSNFINFPVFSGGNK
ncbi:hypothetical protein PEC106568_43140 [Pectobacterium carotovorum subsp. carotovorum]|nr:hypothetical protein PEC106568_43140 [Pectobacterium carotovorum subsp. carotovorum]